METSIQLPRVKDKKFIDVSLRMSKWAIVEPYFKELLERPVLSVEDLKTWLYDRSELDALVQEDARWRFINTSRDTRNKEYKTSLLEYVREIDPEYKRINQQLAEKLFNSGYADQLNNTEFYPYLRNQEVSLRLFREENVKLSGDLTILQKRYEEISGEMSVDYRGKKMTLAELATFLQSGDRDTREETFRLSWAERLRYTVELDELFDKLLELRQQIALNAGYANYLDYKFDELGRFDYQKEDCVEFHNAVSQEVVPLLEEIYRRKKERAGLPALKQWDLSFRPTDKKAIRPFRNTEEMISKSVSCLDKVDPFFGYCLRLMEEKGYLDLESRMGKAPGGYNCTLPESGFAYIFMNSSGTPRDLKTIMHESGHAVHSFLCRDLPVTGFKRIPSEIAELAAMSMELFSMPFWNVFYSDEEDFLDARIGQLEHIVEILPWIACIDAFQHWIYSNPGHSLEERNENWLATFRKFSPAILNWEGIEDVRANYWQRQLHLFKVPLYYIEYGIAQLGAVAIWKQYQQDPEKTLSNYKAALSLGYTKTLPELYESAGIRFDFSAAYIKDIMSFVREKLEELYSLKEQSK